MIDKEKKFRIFIENETIKVSSSDNSKFETFKKPK